MKNQGLFKTEKKNYEQGFCRWYGDILIGLGVNYTGDSLKFFDMINVYTAKTLKKTKISTYIHKSNLTSF